MYKKLINWSSSQYNYLPWRKERTLYFTLVSEIMLQQTTVSTVLNHFSRFTKKFPTIESLAKAKEEDVLKEWKGLGYYRRAKNLRNIAIQINEKYENQIPTKYEELITLKGIGPYTANAIVAIGLNQKSIAIDANIERVLSRIYKIDDEKGKLLNDKINLLFQTKAILNEEKKINYRALNEALMDLGRVYCRALKANCENCPMIENCKSYASGTQLNYPKLIKKKEVSHDLDLLRVLIKKNGKLLVYKKQVGEWLEGQWEMPTFLISTSDKNFKQYPISNFKFDIEKLPIIKTSITKYKIKNFIWVINEEAFFKKNNEDKYMWKKIDDNNFSTATLKALKKMINY
jgi:A/G-specific adenine glycosylase